MDAAGQNRKVAIPRLPGRSPEKKGTSQSEKHRTKTACVNCRMRKVKCTGELPCCRNCEEASVNCVYAQTRKDRLKDVTEQNIQLITLLRDLSLRADNRDKKRIDELLDLVGENSGLGLLGKRPREPRSEEESLGGEARISGSVGSNEDVDIIDEDMFRSHDSRATGFVGQNSEVQWLRHLKNHTGSGDGTANLDKLSSGPPGPNSERASTMSNVPSGRQEQLKSANTQHVTDFTFYLDRNDLDLNITVDEHELPPPEIAERLFECYMATIHTSFPILPQAFEQDFKKYIISIKKQQPLQPTRKWRAILNLTFAIGAQYSHLVNAEWRGHNRDHIVYMTRALRLLELKNSLAVISAPDLALIQTTGLLSLYYLVIGHINRAWVMIGLSIRSALAVGLHLRNEDRSASLIKKDTLLRTWWGLHSIECLVSSTTGRPCVIASEDCTAPLPWTHREGNSSDAFPSQFETSMGRQSSSIAHSGTPASTASFTSGSSEPFRDESFLQTRIRLALITQRTLSHLYSPRATTQSWKQIQMAIDELMGELNDWVGAAFPQGLNLVNPNANMASWPDLRSQREHIMLAFSLFSTKILITKPCLCRLDQRIQGQSKRSASFNQTMAKECVEAAREISELLPDTPDPVQIYQNGPWWCIIHIMMQALAVLLLEVFYDGAHASITSPQIIQSVKKLLLWLRSMRCYNALAVGAYKVIIDILEGSTLSVAGDIIDYLYLAEGEADPVTNQSFQIPITQTFQAPMSHPFQEPMTQPLQAPANQFNDGNLFDSIDWQADEYPNAANPGATPQAQSTEGQHQFIVDGLYSDPYFFSDNLLHLAASNRNPFMTSFDQPNPLVGQDAVDFLGSLPDFPADSQDMPDL